jgi:N-terminal domain of Peptidase_S41 in eukaryotic IRBP
MTATTTESALDVDAIVHAAADLLAEHYVFPDVAAQLADLLRRQSDGGRYRGVESAEALGRLVTDDLQSVNQDRHLRLKFHVDPLPTDAEDDEAAWHAIYVEQAAGAMGGVRGVERLGGNVGLLELAPMLFPADIAGPSITAASSCCTPSMP